MLLDVCTSYYVNIYEVYPVSLSFFYVPAACRGECVRLKQFVTNSEIVDNDVSYCGVHDYRYGGGGKNGEAIYIGTSSNQVCVCVACYSVYVIRKKYFASTSLLYVEGRERELSKYSSARGKLGVDEALCNNGRLGSRLIKNAAYNYFVYTVPAR